ncbi:hypothetical protein [Streptomyces sp. NBC_00091]|uniref:hypothetical protein n=1 Tax=Streptomyces sp. NBC_00091 TaxID=2975648 RepID=UPI0022591549|nr:hypothetical protein [Streptomyces sp. NBC_00091]MCX5380802.1 hypothetical protein [Streptomyces sp. NBC_00091]
MTVFRCSACGTEVSAEVEEMPLPEREGPMPYEAEGECPPRIPPGRFAYDPGPSAFSYLPDRPGQVRRERAGPPGSIVLSPGDARGMAPVAGPGPRGGCCGPDGLGGANLRCTGCRAELAIESADCWTVQQIVLDPRRVVAAPPSP